MFKILARWSALFAVALCSLAAPAQAQEAIKVVYHMSEGIPQASRAINNIRNHQTTHGPGHAHCNDAWHR